MHKSRRQPGIRSPPVKSISSIVIHAERPPRHKSHGSPTVSSGFTTGWAVTSDEAHHGSRSPHPPVLLSGHGSENAGVRASTAAAHERTSLGGVRDGYGEGRRHAPSVRGPKAVVRVWHRPRRGRRKLGQVGFKEHTDLKARVSPYHTPSTVENPRWRRIAQQGDTRRRTVAYGLQR